MKTAAKGAMVWALFMVGGGLSGTQADGQTHLPARKVGPSKVPLYAYRIVNRYPHDPEAFTQGLLFHEGFLYESTGLRGRSSVRQVELETGRVVKSRSLEALYFGEGLALWKDSLVQLTWRSGTGFVYSKESLDVTSSFRYEGEGWGLAHDGSRLVMSDGSSWLRFLDPATFQEVAKVRVSYGKLPVRNINELEYVRGEVYANIWMKDVVARIDPETGSVTGWIDLSGLKDELEPGRPADVLNGIAYDESRDRLFVTGKLWPELFEIELVERETGNRTRPR